jgi:hypothetical protein
MTTIKIPTPEELRTTLNGLDRLLTAKQWERAAIVYAFTAKGGAHNSGREKPAPPRMNLRDFAGQGYQGLSTVKTVGRYREAWLTAIDNGWAGPVNPGEMVNLPDEPFPAWPYGADSTYEDVAASDDELIRQHRTRQWAPLEQRLYSSVDRALSAVRKVSGYDVSPEVRHELRERLTALQAETAETLKALDAADVAEMEPA